MCVCTRLHASAACQLLRALARPGRRQQGCRWRSVPRPPAARGCRAIETQRDQQDQTTILVTYSLMLKLRTRWTAWSTPLRTLRGAGRISSAVSTCGRRNAGDGVGWVGWGSEQWPRVRRRRACGGCSRAERGMRAFMRTAAAAATGRARDAPVAGAGICGPGWPSRRRPPCCLRCADAAAVRWCAVSRPVRCVCDPEREL